MSSTNVRMDTGNKLKQIRLHLNLSQDQFANVLGLAPRAYWNYENNKREIPVSNLASIAQTYDINLNWIFGNADNMFLAKHNINNSQIIDSADEFVTLERIGINPSCGKGTIVLDNAEVTPVILGKKLIENIFRASDISNLKVFRASGDSMEDTIYDNDDLLVDVGRTDYNNGGVFVITINNDWFIKRLQLKINGDLDIISDNKNKYPTETKHPYDDINITVKGRVIKNLSRGL